MGYHHLYNIIWETEKIKVYYTQVVGIYSLTKDISSEAWEKLIPLCLAALHENKIRALKEIFWWTVSILVSGDRIVAAFLWIPFPVIDSRKLEVIQYKDTANAGQIRPLPHHQSNMLKSPAVHPSNNKVSLFSHLSKLTNAAE